MTRRTFGAGLFALTMGLTVCPPTRAQWNLPSPATAVHPGAKQAPASSPVTYPDEAGFQKRARIILLGLATNDLSQWRRGYFAGGDPGKYLPGPAMAKLMLDPSNAEARKFMNDERSYKEHYHFAAVNWARFLPLFGDALTPETKTKLAQQAERFTAYLSGGGTENHKTMWWTSANVLPHYLPRGGRLARTDKEAALAEAKRQLRYYVKGLYAAGQGEWDSSTYLMFDVNGMLNIYDFSPDPEARLLAKAALDWFIAGYALKYRDGVYTAPNQRGFAEGPVQKIADQTGWLWWGSNKAVTPENTRTFNYAVHALTSSWRPNQVLCNIATKALPALPFEQGNSKPNYWHGQGLTPTPSQYQETVYVTKHYTLGSLWNGFGGQITRLQLVASSGSQGGIVFTGGNPRHSDHTGKITDEISYKDGNGRYDQSAQAGGAYISLSKIPDEEPLAYSFFSLPEAATRPVRRGDWWVMQAGNTFIGLRGLGDKGVIGQSDLTPEQEAEYARAKASGKAYKNQPFPILRFAGRRTGFILQTADTDRFPTLDAFAAALRERARVDTPRFAERMEVVYTTLDGKAVRIRYRDGSSQADSAIDGKAVHFEDWPVYGGPYITQRNGILSINDGRAGFVVDFRGDLPVYKPWSAGRENINEG